VTESLEHLAELRRTERRVAMATLVATRGTTPKKEGAKMWVGDGGRILGSVTIGGCVDAKVIAAAEEVLRSSHSALLSMPLGDEDAWEMGLTCGGTVDVLVESVDFSAATPAAAAFAAVEREYAAGRATALVTPLAGDPPRPERLVVLAGGSTEGTLGDAALDKDAVARAHELMRQGISRTATLSSGSGPVDVFIEVHAPPPALVIVGATHVAIPLVSLARQLGWRTIVVDARDRFASRERFPDADELVVGMAGEFAERFAWTPASSIVLVAHDYKVELPVLRIVLRREVGYVGVLGGKRRGAALRDFLVREGYTDDELARIHLPIGLQLGAESSAEIALSIIAQVTAVKNRAPAAAR
jgi:xanthine dehydrogenase accessory factor